KLNSNHLDPSEPLLDALTAPRARARNGFAPHSAHLYRLKFLKSVAETRTSRLEISGDPSSISRASDYTLFLDRRAIFTPDFCQAARLRVTRANLRLPTCRT